MNLLKNKLETLPERITRSPRELDVANNHLKKIPMTFGALNQMERVDLECNLLEILPESLNNMTCCTTLILNNKLSRLPRCIGGMPSLSSQCHSQHDHLHPQELAECRTLRYLRLSLNKITVVPTDW